MQVVQCKLSSDKAEQVVWLDIPKKPLCVGNLVTLKDSDEPERLWKVMSLGLVKEKSELKRSEHWHRNDFVRNGSSFRHAK